MPTATEDPSGTGRHRGRPGRPTRPAEVGAQWLSWEQAAARVGCPVSTIDWHTRTGRIVSRPREGARPTVSAASLEAFQAWWWAREELRAASAERRAEFRKRRARAKLRQAARDAGYEPQLDRPPGAGDWVSMAVAARRLGCTPATVKRRADDGRLTAVRQGRRIWVQEASLAELVAEEERWLSYVEAAELVGCSRGVIGAAVRVGRLEQRDVARGLPSLKRVSVERFKDEHAAAVRAKRRAVEARESAAAERAAALGPPDDGHVWLDVATVALLLGVGRSRVGQLAAADRLPHVRTPAGRVWFRRDHVEVVAAARAVRPG